jgi:hypothetical protein
MKHSEEYMPEDRRNPGPLGGQKISTGELKIQVWRNSADQDWSVEINNKRYSSMPFELVKQRVAQALKDAKKSLMERRTNRTCQ